MLDTHEKIVGIMPYIFGISSYSVFVLLGIVIGLIFYWFNARNKNDKTDGAIVIVASALIFGIIGSKVPLLFEGKNLSEILTGKSIVGGLVGGIVGYMAGSKFGNAVYNGVKKVCTVAKNTVKSMWERAKEFGRGIKDRIGQVTSKVFG